MTHKQASYSPGLNPIKGQKFCPGTQTGSRDELSSLSLGITKTSPLSPVPVDQPATEPLLQISPTDTQGWLRSKKPQSRAAPREPISDFIASYSGVFLYVAEAAERLLAVAFGKKLCWFESHYRCISLCSPGS